MAGEICAGSVNLQSKGEHRAKLTPQNLLILIERKGLPELVLHLLFDLPIRYVQHAEA